MDIEEIKDFRPLILVAEDDDSNFKLIKAIIGKKCDILWAKNGEEMLNLYREHTQDAHAILMDIKMPIMNGLKQPGLFVKKELPSLLLCRLLMLLAQTGECHAGASEVLVKPITVSALRGCLSSYFPEIKW